MLDWRKTVAWSDRKSALEAAQPPNKGAWWRDVAAVAVALLIAATLLLSGRYQLTTDPRTGMILRTDTITGAVRLCVKLEKQPFDLDCSGNVDDWVAVPTK